MLGSSIGVCTFEMSLASASVVAASDTAAATSG